MFESPAGFRLRAWWKNKIVPCITTEQERLFLWFPVLTGGGIAFYFGHTSEPPIWLGSLLFSVSVAFFWFSKTRQSLLLIGVLAIGLSLGFAVAQWRVISLSPILLTDRHGPAGFSGKIDSLEISQNHTQKLVISNLQLNGLNPNLTPEKIRLSLRGKQPPLKAGDWISGTAVIEPAQPPVLPGAFDFQRHLFFQEIGGVGFALGSVEHLKQNEKGIRGPFVRFSAPETLEQWRADLMTLIKGQSDSQARAMAVALITGQRGLLSEQTIDDMRASGLAHLLAISGLHIGLVAGLVFVTMRFILALIPSLALRYSTKKWAALGAIVAALAYALISGASVPTLRAFIMSATILGAILLERQALSMRTVAWAALAILLTQPESLLSASFQLSFAAVIALIAAYEVKRKLHGDRIRSKTIFTTFFSYLGSIILTSLIAALATAPFAIFHFNQATPWGVFANILSVPLTAFWIMPWGLFSILLMPFGWQEFALIPMSLGTNAILHIATWFAHLPAAHLQVQAMSVEQLGLITLAGLWLCLWQGRWRLWSLPILMITLIIGIQQPRPDLIVDASGNLIALRGEGDHYSFSNLNSARFRRTAFIERLALNRDPTEKPQSWMMDKNLRCDPQGCLLDIGAGQVIAFPETINAFIEDCPKSVLTISLNKDRITCRPARNLSEEGHDPIVIDRPRLDREGTHAIYLAPNGPPSLKTVGEARGQRPWVISHGMAWRETGY